MQRNGNGSMQEYLLYEELLATIHHISFQIKESVFSASDVMKKVNYIVTSIKDLQERKYVFKIMKQQHSEYHQSCEDFCESEDHYKLEFEIEYVSEKKKGKKKNKK